LLSALLKSYRDIERCLRDGIAEKVLRDAGFHPFIARAKCYIAEGRKREPEGTMGTAIEIKGPQGARKYVPARLNLDPRVPAVYNYLVEKGYDKSFSDFCRR